LAQAGRGEEALEALDGFLSGFAGDADDPARLYALYQKADVLQQAKRYDESLSTYQQMLDSVDADPPELPYLILNCLSGKAQDEYWLGKPVEAMKSLADLIVRYDEERVLYPRGKVAWAHVAQGRIAQSRGAHHLAVISFDEAIRHVADTSDPTLRDAEADARARREPRSTRLIAIHVFVVHMTNC